MVLVCPPQRAEMCCLGISPSLPSLNLHCHKLQLLTSAWSCTALFWMTGPAPGGSTSRIVNSLLPVFCRSRRLLFFICIKKHHKTKKSHLFLYLMHHGLFPHKQCLSTDLSEGASSLTEQFFHVLPLNHSNSPKLWACCYIEGWFEVFGRFLHLHLKTCPGICLSCSSGKGERSFLVSWCREIYWQLMVVVGINSTASNEEKRRREI